MVIKNNYVTYSKTYRSRHSSSEHPTLTRHVIGREIRAVKAGLNTVLRGSSLICKTFWKIYLLFIYYSIFCLLSLQIFLTNYI